MRKPVWNRVIAAILALFCLSGCAERKTQASDDTTPRKTEQAADQELQQAKADLLEVCFRLLEANEKMDCVIFQCLDYTDTYIETASWDDLLKARASATAATTEIRQMELPEFPMAETEVELLETVGIEANAIQREYEDLEAIRKTMSDTVATFRDALENNVFLSASVEDEIPAMVTFYREYYTLLSRYMGLLANYMLLQMDAVDTWQVWAEQVPHISACTNSWYDQTGDVEKAVSQVLDEIQALENSMGDFLGISEYTLEIVQDAVETGDMETLQRQINVMGDVPGFFPTPVWLQDQTSVYLVTDLDTQEKRAVQAGELLSSIPSACYISCGAIPLEDVTDYEVYLGQWGIETYGRWNEAMDTWQLLVKSGSSSMLIEWKEHETLLYLTEPVGCLIPELYFYAMTLKQGL